MAVAPELLERWLAARDHVAIRAAWAALPVTRHRLGTVQRKCTLHGAALLAEAMLGERADWLVERSQGTPVYDVNRISEGAVLDHVWNIDEKNNESLVIHERRDGLRGVQLVMLSSGTVTGRPEGGAVKAVRIFDRDRAAVVPVETYVETDVATIGDVDLAPLDLLLSSRSYRLEVREHDVATMRALVAQLVSEVDAHYDTSPQWAEGHAAVEWYDVASVQYVDGSRVVSIAHDQRSVQAQVLGLNWGQRFRFHLERNGYCNVTMQFSGAQLDRIEERLAALGAR